MAPLEIPSAQAGPSAHADWIELEALQSPDGVCSVTEFASRVHASGTTEALTEPEDDEDPADRGGEQSQQVADDAWHEIERRHSACGGDGGHYPFALSNGAITLVAEWESSLYVFQMLLTRFGHKAGPKGTYGDRLFESLSAIAGRNYFGESAQSHKFGFPREERTGFVEALQQLCTRMKSGLVNEEAAQIHQQKDSHLDVVVWRPFLDDRPSILIGFGQCATGDNWDKHKLTELQPENFQKKWLREGFHPNPIRLFFLPHSVPQSAWRNASIDGGVVFDRCRITHLTGQVAERADYKVWTRHVARACLGRP